MFLRGFSSLCMFVSLQSFEWHVHCSQFSVNNACVSSCVHINFSPLCDVSVVYVTLRINKVHVKAPPLQQATNAA